MKRTGMLHTDENQAFLFWGYNSDAPSSPGLLMPLSLLVR